MDVPKGTSKPETTIFNHQTLGFFAHLESILGNVATLEIVLVLSYVFLLPLYGLCRFMVRISPVATFFRAISMAHVSGLFPNGMVAKNRAPRSAENESYNMTRVPT